MTRGHYNQMDERAHRYLQLKKMKSTQNVILSDLNDQILKYIFMQIESFKYFNLS